MSTTSLPTKTTDIPTEKTSKQEILWERIEREDLTRIATVAALITGAFCVYCLGNFPIALFAIHCTLADIILLAAGIIGSKPILSEAKEALLEKRMNMELSMAIALTAALAIGEFLTVALIILFVLIAEEIEKLTIERGRRSIKSLLGSLPQEIFIEDEVGEIKTINISAAQPGQIAVIKPGSHIAIDGLVISGNSTVEQSSITGEMLPVSKEVGSIIYAGTINQSGALRVRIETTGVETAYGKLLKTIEAAENSPAPIENIADRLSGYLVYLALAWAAITYLCTKDLPSTISVIVVAGACGVAAGTPLAILGAIGQAARAGVIVKAGQHVETLAKVKTVIFDKTGTLTMGQPLVTHLLPTPKFTELTLLSAAATCELFSEHPLAHAIKAKAQEKNITPKAPDQFKYMPGQGVVCQLQGRQIIAGTASLLAEHDINIGGLEGLTMPQEMSETSVFVAVDKEFAGVILTADKIRPEACDVIKKLDAFGICSVLLSGDSGESVKAIARQTGIAKYQAGMLPTEKSDYIRAEQSRGRKLAMIGDGINDAPALVRANIGIAIGSGTDIALQSADAMLVKNNLLNLVDSIVIARRCYGIIWFNFIGTIVVDVIGMALASSGHLNPLAAALVHVGSELLFIFNSARLLVNNE